MLFQRLLQFHYLATPLYFLLDYFTGFNIRTAALEAWPFWKYVYYVLCMSIGGINWVRPKWTSVSSLSECTLNITLLIIGFMKPILLMPDAIMSGGELPSPPTVAQVGNFPVSGSIMLVSFHRNPIIRSGQ